MEGYKKMKKEKKKICIFLGSRANYSSLRPIMRKIQSDPDLELILFVGASALLDKFGEVVKLVKKDGFEVQEYIYMLVEGSNPTTMAKSTGLGLMEMANLLYKHNPDLVLIIGDRHEMLSMVIASAFMNIPVAHTMGGEISGTIDESIRHAITKFAHIHFPANEQARKNIIRMGEKEETVFNVGCPRMDAIKEIIENGSAKKIKSLMEKQGVGDTFEIKNEFLLISQHPVTSEFGKGEEQINKTLQAVKEIHDEQDIPIIVLWPNADAGSDEVARGIRKFRENNKNSLQKFHFFKNLPMNTYVHLLNNVSCLVGNSSSGIREGAFLGTPVVNIGSRQEGRQQGQNVLNVNCNKEEIKKTILKQIKHGRYDSDPVYGNGNTSQKIVDIIKNTKVDTQKKLNYQNE
jgi:UDP-hydrolysing UDP-N-acetyl-D-glucosamine 2-epimerase